MIVCSETIYYGRGKRDTLFAEGEDEQEATSNLNMQIAHHIARLEKARLVQSCVVYCYMIPLLIAIPYTSGLLGVMVLIFSILMLTGFPPVRKVKQRVHAWVQVQTDRARGPKVGQMSVTYFDWINR